MTLTSPLAFNAMRLFSLLTWLVVFAAVATADDTAAAFADRAKFPPEVQAGLRYISTDKAMTKEERLYQEISLKLLIPSATRQDNLDYCQPIQVGNTLWRIDLNALHWAEKDWLAFVAKYPYHPTGYFNPLVIDAGWFLVHLSDQTESDAYLRFVFGRLPKNRDDALAIVAVGNQFPFGLIEADSGVAVNKIRWIENRSIARGYVWGTRDFLNIDAAHDPLERPDGAFKHDGEEWIIGLPKFHPETGYRGALQVYFLSNGQGQLVAKAPIDLVEDHLTFRGVAEIRNPGSCIQCHSHKLNIPGPNEYKTTRDIGVEFKAIIPLNEKIASFHLSDVTKELGRNNDDCGQVIKIVTGGVEAEEAVLAFSSAVGTYDTELNLERAAHWFGMEPKELSLAIAYANANKILIGTRFAALAEGKSIPRSTFEERYQTVLHFVANQWRTR